MYIRWGRSTTREGLRALRFTPRRAVSRGLLRGAAIAVDAVTQPLAILLRLASIVGGAWLLFASPLWLLRTLLLSTLIALPYAFVYLRSERSSDVVFGILYGWFALYALFWVQPFATITVRRNGWLTRG
jgi:hyaluronan synthase